MKKFLLLLFFALLLSPATAQEVTLRGRITDAGDGTPLAFVNIVTADGAHGTVSDVEGRFTLTLPEKVCCLKISCVGYAPLTWHIDYSRPVQQIRLHYRPVALDAVRVLPGINPAHRIIRQAVAHRKDNDPEKLDRFSYTSYDKMIITIDADSLLTCDTTLLDSSELALRHFLEKQHLFILETVTRRRYIKPDLNQNIVLASKISGFRDPVIVLMLSQLQTPFFYREHIRILTKDYVNPVSRGSIKKYLFILEDTIIRSPGDTTFIISFRPKRNTTFNALQGFLSINSRGWAIENVKAEPATDTSGIEVTIQQAYRRFDTLWFPEQLKTDIHFLNGASAEHNGKSYHPVAHAVSFLRDINLNPDIRKRDLGFDEVEVEPAATPRDTNYWQRYRVTPLDSAEQETYRFLDSIGRAENFDRYAGILLTLASGAIPAGPFDIDMDKFMHYNDYEGFYLGAGLHTNGRFSKVVRLGGFGGYGFRDETAKYGGDLEIKVHKASGSTLRLEYYYKALPEGGTSFAGEKNALLDLNNYSRFFTRRMNMTEGMSVSFRFRIKPLRDFKWNIAFIRQKKEAFGTYMYLPFDAADTSQVYHLSLMTMEFRYAFREKTIKTTRGTLSLGSDYPTVWFKYSRGFNNFLDGDFSYHRFDLRVSDRMSTKYHGDFLWSLSAGIVTGHTPATELFAANGTYRIFTLYAPNSFGTMRTSEFLSDKYAALYLTWDFRDLLVHIRNWKPRLMLLTNIAVGNLSRPADHLNFDFSTLSKGYYESGFVIRQLIPLGLTDLGFGILYRYGPYSLPQTKDNFAYKFSIYYSF